MKYTNIRSLSMAAAGISLLLGAAILPVSANTEGSADVRASVGVRANDSGAHVDANARMEAKTEARKQGQDDKNKNNLERAIAKGDKEIANRIASLNKLSARISQMKNVSASVKAAITAGIQTQIANLTSLKASIDASTSASSTKDLDKSVMSAYRIYALILPQAQILAAADRVTTIADMMVTVSAKLQTNIDAAHAAGKDVTNLQASLADIAVKIADAKAQAGIAVNAAAALTPDNGDATKAAANRAALVSARANIRTATSDLETARKDARSIMKGLKEFHLNASSTSSVRVNR